MTADVPNSDAIELRFKLEESSKMFAQSGAPAFGCFFRLTDHHRRIAEQHDIGSPNRQCDFRSLDQRQPFAIVVAAMSAILLKISDTARNNRVFHLPRIGPTAAIEIDFQPTFYIQSPTAWMTIPARPPTNVPLMRMN